MFALFVFYIRQYKFEELISDTINIGFTFLSQLITDWFDVDL
jgi:hypothetical protein